MKRAVMRGYALVVAAALLLCTAISATIFDRRLTANIREEMTRIAEVMADSFDPTADHDAQARRFSGAAGDLRVTVIAEDGTVTGDSTVDWRGMENHLERAEIREARGTHAAVSVRASATLGRKLMYAVVKTDSGVYIRLAQEYGGLASNLASLLPALLLSAAVSLLVSLFLTGRVARGISRPIVSLNDALTGVKDGQTTLDPESYRYDELRDMAVKINALSADISLHIRRLEEENQKIDFILDNMSEGFVLLDSDHRVLIINRSACVTLGCTKDVVGKHVLHTSRDYTLYESLDAALKRGVDAAVDLHLPGRVVEARLNVVGEKKGSIEGGLIIILSDVTNLRQSTEMRREFFSNASHELKTPITSIKGFAELLSAGVPLDDAQMQELTGRIALETDRMDRLISDIIMISRLESGDLVENRETLELADAVRECCDELALLAAQGEVTLHVECEPGAVRASSKDLHQLAGNLLSNAVKYNVPGGRVDVRVCACADSMVLTVRNDGEPIPPEHQARVFERFYRVDKGRSKTVGGTGLGLSIVKHVVDTLGGSIELTSDALHGTLFTVTLPRAHGTGEPATNPQEGA